MDSVWFHPGPHGVDKIHSHPHTGETTLYVLRPPVLVLKVGGVSFRSHVYKLSGAGCVIHYISICNHQSHPTLMHLFSPHTAGP